MSIKIEKTENNNELKLEFTVDAKIFAEGIEKVFKKNAKYFSVPGFRKGKVPMNIVENHYGTEIFYEDAFNEVVPEIYDKEIKENNLEVVSKPEIDIVQMEKGKDLIFTAIVQTKPEVELGKYKGIELKKVEYKVEDKDIEHELEMAKELKDLDYQDECRSLCRYCLDFFESLGLDSDEIEALNEAQSFFDQQDSQENQQLEGAKRWVDEMMSNYQNGDTGMYDQMKSTMENLGIDEEKLKNMSKEEVGQYVQDMCKKFGISQSLFDKLKDRFGK